ncbi:hypothetical protein LSAT2_003856 [Lamellibrachia satsuma]|nr:hypothetical protein LSAT2_003856 [Lamellibrachia satsuma]
MTPKRSYSIVTYNKDTHVCCGNELYPKDPNTKCCFDKITDSRAGLCTGKIRLHNPFSCDGMYYDREVAFCCNKKIYAKSPTIGCCVRQLYDPTKFRCDTFMTIKRTLEEIQ